MSWKMRWGSLTRTERAIGTFLVLLLLVPASAAGASWSGARCIGLYFSRRGATNLGDFWFEIDEITFYGTDTWERIRDAGVRLPQEPDDLP